MQIHRGFWAVVLFASLTLAATGRAEDTPQFVVPVVCGTHATDAIGAYQEKIDGVERFGNWSTGAKLAVVIPAAPLVITVAIFANSGTSGDLGTAGLVLIGGAGVAGIDYGLIKGVKHIETRHEREVRDNLKEASNVDPSKDKRLTHTTKIINKKTPGAPYTVGEISAALNEAEDAGDLCKDGKLIVTDDFRDAIVRHLQRRPE